MWPPIRLKNLTTKGPHYNASAVSVTEHATIRLMWWGILCPLRAVGVAVD